MRRMRGKSILAVMLSFSMLGGVLSAGGEIKNASAETETPEFGTQIITEDMLNTTPDKDYKVDMSMQGDAKDGDYNKYFLDDDVQTVKINIDENNLMYMFQNASDKPQVMTNQVTIGDETIGYAGLKTKGSYTLENMPYGNSRFSLTLNFGKYIKKKKYGATQNFHGLSKVSFNNFYFDKSMLKEFCAWKVLSKMGIPTPQVGLAKIYINDKYYGVYFMVENMDSSILEQYKKVDKSEISDYLVKPEYYRMEYNTAMDQFINAEGNFDLSEHLKKNENGDYEASEALHNAIGGLWEYDNDTLQDVAKMIPTVLKWQKKLNQLYNGTDFSGKKIDVNSDEYVKLLDQVIDVDEVVRYYATHSFLVQTDDMFTGEKNFAVYVDKNGKSMMLPWDYDLSMGCFYPTTASATANFKITQMYDPERNDFGYNEEEGYSQYPLFYVIYQNKSLMNKFKKYMKDCSKIAALGGTLSTGETIEPGYINSCIEKIQDKLQAAATMPLTSGGRYINASQPADMKKALPSIKKIYAMRSVGVVSQVDGINATVCGSGCDLSAVGNGQPDRFISMRGKMAIVDEKTGIFAVNTYLGGFAASLTATKLPQDSEQYKTIQSNVQLDAGCNAVEMYSLSAVGSPIDKYTVYVPTASKYKNTNLVLYNYKKDGSTEKVSTKKDDNVYYGEVSELGTLVLATTSKVENKTNTNTTVKKDQAVKGKTYTVKGVKYKVTANGTKRTVTLVKPTSKNKKSITIGKTVTIKGQSFQITAIAANAFAKNKKLKKAVIGASVKTIGAKAFYQAKKLKSLVVKSKKLTKVGKNALKGIQKKAVIKVPSSKLKKYKKLFKNKGQKKTVKIKK